MSKISDMKRSSVRKKLVIFFLLDVSNSMNDGRKIDALNLAMVDVINSLVKYSAENPEGQICVSPMLFGTGPDGMDIEMLVQEPAPVNNFDWDEVKAGGWTPLSKALRHLNKIMSREEHLDSPSGCFAPVVIYVTDGLPVVEPGVDETDEVRAALAELNGNGWYNVAIKAAVSIGDDADLNLLAEMTAEPKNVFTANNSSQLTGILDFIALKSTEINTKLAGASGNGNTAFGITVGGNTGTGTGTEAGTGTGTEAGTGTGTGTGFEGASSGWSFN